MDVNHAKKLQTAVKAFRALSSHEFVSERRVKGTISDPSQCEGISKELEGVGLLDIAETSQNNVCFYLPASPLAYFATELKDLTENACTKIHIPDIFYIADLDYLYDCDNGKTSPPENVQKYFDVVNFISFLCNIADHEIGNPLKKIIFFKNGKVEIPLTYSIDDLKRCRSLNRLKEFFDDSTHKEQKRAIIRNNIFHLVELKEEAVRLKFLLENCDNLYHKVNGDYETFMSSFSIEKTLDDIEGQKRDYFLKINDLIAQISGRILALPLASALAALKFERVKGWSLTNFLLLLSIVIFSLSMFFVLRNQRDSLNAIKSEISYQKKAKGKFPDIIKKDYYKMYEKLNKRCERIDLLLNIFFVTLFFLTTMVIVIFFYYLKGLSLETLLIKMRSFIEK
ncbi:hypothetical protein [Aminobacterium sp. EBM-42]|uniref:hypothetical protein n=1 Tax=Aminobacterium sp. EBM-42 TaxID=1918503 RepID=UPI00257B7FFA|nr:hypothetical protein [Aminobacterium sp. EBM-42]